VRIAQIHWAFPPIIGGVESHLATLGPDLVKNNCQVALLTGSAPGAETEEWYEGMLVIRTPLLDLNSMSPERMTEQKPAIREVMEGFINRVQPEVIHAHNMHYFSPSHADILLDIKRRKGIPLVLTAHNVWADNDETWRTFNTKAFYWDAVIAVSDYIKRELVRVGYDENRITTIHHGIDLSTFAPASEQEMKEIKQKYPEFEGRRVIFHPARMSMGKGCHISVKALSIIKKEFPDVLLVMAGTRNTVDWGAQQPEHIRIILRMIEELGLKKHVWVKFFSWKDMPSVYNAAEFCIYPSCFEEPFGLAMLESMACAKPIIVSKAGGMPEVIQNGVNGFIVEMGNERELAEKCLLLLRNPALSSKIGRQGRVMVEKRWAKQVMTRSTIDIYKKVLAAVSSAAG